MIQMTFDRFSTIAEPEIFWVVTNAKYVDIVHEQLPEIPAENILAEPAARNTAPCVAWAGWRILQKDPDANIVVTPADAVILNVSLFRAIIGEALDYTRDTNAIVTLGIVPNRPETGYGYVEVADSIIGNVHKVASFREKPDLETARKYLEAGNYLWNAGIFVWNVRTLAESIRQYVPQIAGLMDRMVPADGKEGEAVEAIFPTCEKISIDYAVMEKHPNVCTIPADVQWSDLGNWQSLYEKLPKDDDGNAAVGNVRFFESSNNIVHMESCKRVVIQGIHDCILSEKNGQILICQRSEEQRIKEFSAE